MPGEQEGWCHAMRVLHGCRGQMCSLRACSEEQFSSGGLLSLPSISPSPGHGHLSPAPLHTSLGGRGAVAICSVASGSVEICPALAAAVGEGLEAAGLDELGRSDCIPGWASCLACSPEARGKAGVSRPKVSAFAPGIREIQIMLQSNLRWPGCGCACLAGM